jgi:hypothetical protein
VTTPVYALKPDEVQTGSSNGPGIYLAPVGTALPADTSTPFGTPWDILGYLSDDGPTVGQATDSNDLIPWQSVVPLRSVITKRTITLQFILWQLNELTMGLYFDADPPTPAADGSISMTVRSDTPQHLYAIAIDAADADRVMRLGFTRASLSDAGDMQLKRGEAVPLDCKLTALDDAGVMATILLGPGSGALAAGAAAGTTKSTVRSG